MEVIECDIKVETYSDKEVGVIGGNLHWKLSEVKEDACDKNM